MTMKDCEIHPIYRQELKNLQHANYLASNLFDFKNINLLCDVTLVCGKAEITAHKVILAACSKYFQAMFTSGMCETLKTQIPMKKIDTDSLVILVNYAYTGVIIIDEINVQTLLETSDLLQFESAKTLCCDFIKAQLNLDNCLDVFQFAELYHCNEILSISQTMFNKNWKKLIHTDAFASLEYHIIVKLISSDSLDVVKESSLLYIICKWIESHLKERKDLFLPLLQHVRWTYVEPMELKHVVKHQPLIATNKHVKSMVESYIAPNLCCPLVHQMRRSYESWMYVLGGEQSFLMELKSCEFFNHQSAQWDYGFSLHGPRTSFAAVSHSDKLYVIGGMRFGEKLKIVECFNHKVGKWKRLASLKKCKGDVEAVVSDEIVYVAGGSSDGEPACRYVEKYDESNNQWLTVANMKSRRRRFGLSEYKSKLYAFGGFQDSQGELRTCEVYEPDSNIWQSIAPMKTNRCDLGAAVLSDCIYIAGGVNSYTGSITTVERYNPVTDTWSQCQPLLQARGGHAMVTYFGRIIAIGGMNSYMQTCKDAEWYNEVTNEWKALPSTNMPRFGGVAVVLPFCRRPTTYNEEDARNSSNT